jgi:myo-inositol-1(or 4)-monophosphatase
VKSKPGPLGQDSLLNVKGGKMVGKGHGIDELSGFAMKFVQQAGKKALAHYGKGNPQVKFDEGVVTEAELQLSEFFQKQLQKHYPKHHVFRFNEVKKNYSHEDERYLWIFDPFDGVANFQAGIPVWGLSLALLENFWPILGVFYMPATGDLFHARAGQNAFLGQKEIHVSTKEIINNESLLFTYSRFHHCYRTTFPGKIRNLGCASAHICYVAMGRADAVLVANESFQGLAAARFIIEAAGGKFCKLDGCDFYLNEYLDGQRIEDHLLIAAPENFSQVRDCLTPNA